MYTCHFRNKGFTKEVFFLFLFFFLQLIYKLMSLPYRMRSELYSFQYISLFTAFSDRAVRILLSLEVRGQRAMGTRRVLVTGCSSGIGLAVAARLAKDELRRFKGQPFILFHLKTVDDRVALY